MKHEMKSMMMAMIAGLAMVGQTVFAGDAAAELAALKAKYPEALERCSVFEMMHKVKELQEIDAAQRHCIKEKDWAGFEQVAQAAIGLKANLDGWYYNLSCALSLQKKIPEALVALEQSVAAGYRDRAHVEQDGDMENLRKEKRYAELLELMDFNEKNFRPLEAIKVKDGRIMPTEATLDCSTEEDRQCFFALLETGSNDCPIVYMDRNRPHRDPIGAVMPELGLIEIEYPEEMKKFGQDVGAANLGLCAGGAADNVAIPVVAATDVTGSLYRGSSLATDFGQDFMASIRLGFLVDCYGVIQVAASGKDYGSDGYDRYLSNIPLIVNYVGGEEEQRFFVRSIVRAIRALPVNVRNDAMTNSALVAVVQKLLRASQKNVRSADDYLSGAAHRPAFFADQIDAERMVRMAGEMKALPPAPPMLVVDDDAMDATDPVCELEIGRDGMRSRWVTGMCGCGSGIVFRGLRRTLKLRFADESKSTSGKVTWKVLQGDPEKTRVVRNGEFYDVEVDYQPVFEVADAYGNKVKTCRVDIGFFREQGDEYSLPYIVSVAMPPHDTRTYDGDGRLVEADYSKPQIEPTNFVAKAFVRGYWRDAYHYAEDGKFLGWTRDVPGDPGAASEWNSAYMVVVERDELGRPSRLARPRIYEWVQDEPLDENDDTPGALRASTRSILLDNSEEDFIPVTWVCEYASTNDFVGEINEIPYAGYSPRRLCPYADFAAETNRYAYPLSMELDDAGRLFQLSKLGTYLTNHELANVFRESGEPIPMARRPKKMKFAEGEREAWRWPGIRDVERSFSTNLIRISDGAYRFLRTAENGDQWLESVSETRRMWNAIMSAAAAERMDEAKFERCTTNELRLALEYTAGERFASSAVTYVSGNDREYVRSRQNAVTGWHVADGVCMVVLSEGQSGTALIPGLEMRLYRFAFIDTNAVERTVKIVDFDYFPTEEMMFTGMGGYLGGSGETDNDLAVLLYSGAIDYYRYDEEHVLYYLNRAARKNYSRAIYNLGVFYENRLDSERARECYRHAGRMEKHQQYERTYADDARFGGTNIAGWAEFLEAEMKRKPDDVLYAELALALMAQESKLRDAGGVLADTQADLIGARVPALILSGAEAGDLEAMEFAALMASRIGSSNAVKYAQRAVATGFAGAGVYCELADAYRNGLGGLETNAVKAVELLTYAAEVLRSDRARQMLRNEDPDAEKGDEEQDEEPDGEK